MVSEDLAATRKNELAASLVRRNDFSAKIMELTGELAELSDQTKRISFQDHFSNLIQKTLKIIRRPINTENMMPFHLAAQSKIKEILDMNKLCQNIKIENVESETKEKLELEPEPVLVPKPKYQSSLMPSKISPSLKESSLNVSTV